MLALLQLFNIFLTVLSYFILVEVIISWAMMFGARGLSPYHPIVRFVHNITDPVLAPFRMIVPPSRLNGLDISPMLAYFCIWFLQGFITQLTQQAMVH